MCPCSCAGLGEFTRRHPATPPMPAAWGPPTWNLPARAGPRHQSQALGCWCSLLEAPQRSHRFLPSPVLPQARVWLVGKPLPTPPAPPAIPGQSRRASRTGAKRRPRHPRADARGERLQAPGLSAVPAPRLPAGCPAGARGRHPTRPSSSAGTWPLRRCGKEAPQRRFFHTHVHLVCAPQACRCYPAGATRISARPHPPWPQHFKPCI